MKRFIHLLLAKNVFILFLFPVFVNAQEVNKEPPKQETLHQGVSIGSTLKKVWEDDIQFHGFLSQGLFHSTGNNVFGKSKNSVSAGLTEIGLNMSYRAFSQLSFAAQGLYRRAGANTGDWGEVTLDYALFDFMFLNIDSARVGLRGGRVKNPWGLYNETRDVAFTRPTILLPLAYYDRSRTLFLAMDGGQFYADYFTVIGDFSFKLNYGLANANDRELLLAITLDPSVSGHLKSEPSLVTQLNYEVMGGQYVFAVSYAQLNMGYSPANQTDPYTGLKSKIDSFMLSAQYNGEKITLVGEYVMQWSEFKGTQTGPNAIPVSEYWYLQAGYRFLGNLQATIRYDSWVRDTSDRSGQNFHQQTTLPAHMVFTQDVVVGLRWDVSPSWMIRAEYSRVHGAGTVSQVDNPNFSEQALDWDIYALQVAFRF